MLLGRPPEIFIPLILIVIANTIILYRFDNSKTPKNVKHIIIFLCCYFVLWLFADGYLAEPVERTIYIVGFIFGIFLSWVYIWTKYYTTNTEDREQKQRNLNDNFWLRRIVAPIIVSVASGYILFLLTNNLAISGGGIAGVSIITFIFNNR